MIILENIKSNEPSLRFSKIVSKGLCCDKVWEISIFPSCTPIRGILYGDVFAVVTLFQCSSCPLVFFFVVVVVFVSKPPPERCLIKYSVLILATFGLKLGQIFKY